MQNRQYRRPDPPPREMPPRGVDRRPCRDVQWPLFCFRVTPRQGGKGAGDGGGRADKSDVVLTHGPFLDGGANGADRLCTAVTFPLQVTFELSRWLECFQRTRTWYPRHVAAPAACSERSVLVCNTDLTTTHRRKNRQTPECTRNWRWARKPAESKRVKTPLSYR
jgi:hypothetical protein